MHMPSAHVTAYTASQASLTLYAGDQEYSRPAIKINCTLRDSTYGAIFSPESTNI